jgi:hypothetical protein
MLARREARLAYFKEHGKFPPRWKGLLPGEPDHYERLAGFHRWRKGGLAKIRARLRKHPNTQWQKLANRYQATTRIRSKPRKSAALDDVMARFLANLGAKTGKLTLKEFEALKPIMLADDALPRRFRKKRRTGSAASADKQNESGEEPQKVPQTPIAQVADAQQSPPGGNP